MRRTTTAALLTALVSFFATTTFDLAGIVNADGEYVLTLSISHKF